MSAADRKGAVGVPVFWLYTWPRRFGFALIAVAVATLLRYPLSGLLGSNLPFLLFYPVIWLVAWMAGLGPGVFAVFLSEVSASFLLFGTASPVTVGLPLNANGLVLFTGAGIVMSAVADMYRRRAERLREFERVAGGVEEGIIILDRQYRYVSANRVYLGYRGVKKEELVGRSLAETMEESVFETTVKPKLDECFRGKVVRYEKRYKYAGLGERDFSVSYFPIEGPTGVERVACILQDITEQKEAQTLLEQKELLFRTLVESAPMAMVVSLGQGQRAEFYNPKFTELFGYTQEEVPDVDHWWPLAYPDEAYRRQISEVWNKAVQEAIASNGETPSIEARVRCKNGSEREVEFKLVCAGEKNLVFGTDVTEIKRSERALKLFRTLIDHSNDAVEVVDPETLRFLDVNETACKDLGYTRDELLAMTVFDVDPKADEACWTAVLDGLRDSGFVIKQTFRRRKDGSTFPVELSIKHVQLDRVYHVVIARDITERKQSEEALREREEKFHQVADNIQEIFWMVDAETRQAIFVNPAFEHITGRTVASLMDSPLSYREIIHSDDRVHVLSRLEEAARTGILNEEFRIVRPDGTVRWVEAHGFPIRNVEGKIYRLAGVVQDITARRLAEEAVRDSEDQYRDLVDHSEDLVCTHDLEGRLLSANPAAARSLGYEVDEFLKIPMRELMVPEYRELFDQYLRRIKEKGADKGLMCVMARSGEVRTWEYNKTLRTQGVDKPVVRGMAHDVTEKRRAELALEQSEERFRVALKDSPITVFNQDCELRYTWIYNPQLYWQHEAIGKTDAEVIGPRKAASLVELKRRVLKAGVGLREDVVIPNDGKNCAFDIWIEPLFSADGSIVGITGAAIDIARLREMADRLQDARDKLLQEKSYLENEIQTELGFEAIVGHSPALRDVLKNVRVVAPTDSTVLLTGETGTGKELVARSVHALSSRRDKTFIKLNCAAVPSGLLESELFGHEKGAFTGAVSQKVGRIELADKGTLFLDEIGELPLDLQPKLLRVLQDRDFERLGGVHTLHVDVRIISATNRDLHQDIAERLFREDLFYRLNVFPIELPSLRERRDDIPILVHHFVRKHSARMGKHIDTVPEETMNVLQKWNWPGNIRELENMIERMVILSKGRVLAEPPVELDAPQETGDDNLADMGREHIIRILQETGGLLSGPDGAASRLGVKRTTLQSMLKRFGIALQDFRRTTGTFGPG